MAAVSSPIRLVHPSSATAAAAVNSSSVDEKERYAARRVMPTASATSVTVVAEGPRRSTHFSVASTIRLRASSSSAGGVPRHPLRAMGDVLGCWRDGDGRDDGGDRLFGQVVGMKPAERHQS